MTPTENGESEMGKEITTANISDAICEMRRIVTVYDAAIGLPRRHPAATRLLTRSEARADAQTPPPDTRTPEERLNGAVRRYMALEGWLGYTDKAASSETRRVVIDDGACVDREGLLSALRCVSDGLKGKRMVYRGRS